VYSKALKRRGWREVHLGIDEQSLEIRAVEVTSNDMGDAPTLPELLGQSPPDQKIATVTADGACEMRRPSNCWLSAPWRATSTARSRSSRSVMPS
jgi:hypothetical protein